MSDVAASLRPERTCHFRHVLLDSDRWDAYKPRPSDIVITTSMKAGTTWMQTIVACLLFPDGRQPAPTNVLSPWFDLSFPAVGDVVDLLETQKHRRFVKSHLPANAIRYFDEVRYLVIGRDGRDVFMSLVNHYERMKPEIIAMANHMAPPDIPHMPLYSEAFDSDPRAFFDHWISTGSVPSEGDGSPFWSHFAHIASWWPYRHLPNVRLVHFNDLLVDLEGEMQAIAEWLAIDVPERFWPEVVERATFASMKENADDVAPVPFVFDGGGDGFLHSGTNGRWRDVLSGDQLQRYEARVKAVLTPDCASWLEHGSNAVATGKSGSPGSPKP
ncbi:MAG: sulfotransferase domain-containing protein [Actinobacteria bacterium]|nr:sulfotransferase domain-containing protein [Actinomycetota bacterium]